VLEVAPGPGYLAIALAQLGTYRVAGLDVSRTFVRMARENAARSRVEVDFRKEDAAAMPFAAEAFDFIVCRAAFKNSAIRSAHCARCIACWGRREGAIIDMRIDASGRPSSMRSRRCILAASTRSSPGHLSALRKRAYSKADFEGWCRPRRSADVTSRSSRSASSRVVSNCICSQQRVERQRTGVASPC